MKIITQWFKDNWMHLNIGKCNYIIYAYKTPTWANDLEIKINDIKIERVTAVKYLGLILDEKLTWRNNSEYIQTKLRKQNFLFYHLKNYFNITHLKRIYKPLYEASFTYGIIHWGASKHIKPIKVLQNKVCRTILNSNNKASESEIYPMMGVMGLEEIYKTRLLMFVFKNKGLFQLHDTAHMATRSGNSLVPTYPHLKKFHSRLQARYRGYELFRALPESIRGEKRLGIYKREIAKIIQSLK